MVQVLRASNPAKSTLLHQHASPLTVPSSTVRNTPVSTQRCGGSMTIAVDEVGHDDGCEDVTKREEREGLGMRNAPVRFQSGWDSSPSS